MAISRMQEPQQIQRGLGSLDVPRQNYGFGSFVKKAVKKATRGVKKVAKSPLGKAALIGGGLWASNAFGPTSGWFGKMTGGKGWGGIGNLLRSGAGSAWDWAAANKGKAAFLGAGLAATALPFLMGGDEPEEEVEEAWTSVPSNIADIRNQARAHYTTPASSTLSFMPDKQFVNTNFYAADGGRAGLMNGGEPGQEQIEQMLMAEFVKYKNQGGTLTFEQFVEAIMQAQQEGQGMQQPQEVAMAADGGRIGYRWGGLGNLMSRAGKGLKNMKNMVVDRLSRMTDDIDIKTSYDYADDVGASMETMITAKSGKGRQILDDLTEQGLVEKFDDGTYYVKDFEDVMINLDEGKIKASGAFLGDDKFTPVRQFETGPYESLEQMYIRNLSKNADGGPVPGSTVPGYTTPAGHNRFDYYSGGDPVRVGKQEGGIMETEVAEEMIDMGGKEKDYRETGGFVDLGRKERADDVPARLSKNEFVFTADAVRAAGGGDIDKGSEVMQNLMDNLEAGGKVSEESQGLEGAQAMYDQQQMLQSRMI